MPRGVYPRTSKQLDVLWNGREKGRKIAWSRPRTKEQLKASCKNLELTRDRYISGRYVPSERVRVVARRLLKRTHTYRNGHCEICGASCFALQDHNHETEEHRGKLCHACNLMLGHAKDNPRVLREAARYLEKYANIRRFPRLKEVLSVAR